MITALKQERKKHGWTQEFVAQHIGTTKQAVQLFENNQCKPSFDVLVRLLDLFEYDDPRQLFAVVDARHPQHSSGDGKNQ